jgi:hypothetical protein
MPMNVVERRFADGVQKKFPDRRVTMARAANMTSHSVIVRRTYCNYCIRGCTPRCVFSS